MGCWEGKHGPYLIAEIGGNHEGSFTYAQQLAELACKSGVDAVKFQIYTGDTLVSSVEDPDRNAHFKRFELEPKEYISLAKLCISHGVEFTASVWNMDALEWIDPYMKFYKIGSGDLTAYPILKRIASIGKPIILSTGLSTFEEVRDSVRYIQDENNIYKKKEYLALLQCTSMYPIPDEDVNLKVMDLFREEFSLTVGYSDHTIGTEAVEVAVAMGAEIIEMHFTDRREGQSFRDHKVSFTAEEIALLIDKIAKIVVLQGRREKRPTKSEIESEHIVSFRRAIYPNRDLKAGTILNNKMLCALRPNLGIDTRCYAKIIGRELKNKLSAFSQFSKNDLL